MQAKFPGRPEDHLAHPKGTLYFLYQRCEPAEELAILHALGFAEPIGVQWLMQHRPIAQAIQPPRATSSNCGRRAVRNRSTVGYRSLVQ